MPKVNGDEAAGVGAAAVAGTLASVVMVEGTVGNVMVDAFDASAGLGAEGADVGIVRVGRSAVEALAGGTPDVVAPAGAAGAPKVNGVEDFVVSAAFVADGSDGLAGASAGVGAGAVDKVGLTVV